MVSNHETPETPLEKISSNTVPMSERNDGEKIHAPIEAHTASGPTMLAEETGLTRSHPEKSMLIFKRLRKELPLPGRKMIYLMTYVYQPDCSVAPAQVDNAQCDYVAGLHPRRVE